MKNINGKWYLTTKEASEKLAVTQAHVRYLARNSKISFLQILKQRYYEPESVHRLVVVRTAIFESPAPTGQTPESVLD